MIETINYKGLQRIKCFQNEF